MSENEKPDESDKTQDGNPPKEPDRTIRSLNRINPGSIELPAASKNMDRKVYQKIRNPIKDNSTGNQEKEKSSGTRESEKQKDDK